jgi:hypothetical protein
MSGIVATVIGALAAAAVGAGLKWGKAFVPAIARRIRPDHAALHARPAWALPASGISGNRSAIRVLAACAPSRSLRPRNIDPDLAIPFIRSSFPGLFPDEPAISLPREGVKFTVSPDGSTSAGFAWAWASGRVDLSAVIELEARPDDRLIVPVLEILRPVALLAKAISSPAYSRVYGKTRTRLPRWFDWFIAVSTDLVRPGDGATVPWDDLEFPGRRPQRASASQYPSCPPGGYARSRLLNWSPRRPLPELLAAFLDDFLVQNGYHGAGQAIADTIRAATLTEIVGARSEPVALAAPLPDPERTGPRG